MFLWVNDVGLLVVCITVSPRARRSYIRLCDKDAVREADRLVDLNVATEADRSIYRVKVG